MKTHTCTEEQFLKDVGKHEMKVLLDNEVHRCIRFASTDQKQSWYLHFTITTWPGYLCINGDMGCFVFTRLPDMFEFFRTKPKEDEHIHINPSYWGEKCEAADRRTGGYDEYDEEVFHSEVARHFREHEWNNRKEKAECWRQIKDEVLNAENEHEAFGNAMSFEYKGDEDKFAFGDFWEHNLRSWTYQYIWCLYAIAWGIRQYDKAHATEEIQHA